MIYAGIALATAPLFTGDAGAQWRARTVPVNMHAYTLAADARRGEWETLVATFERYLPLPRHQHGLLPSNADYLFHRTGGSIALLSDLITDAATDAIDTGREAIALELLDTIAVDDEERTVDDQHDTVARPRSDAVNASGADTDHAP